MISRHALGICITLTAVAAAVVGADVFLWGGSYSPKMTVDSPVRLGFSNALGVPVSQGSCGYLALLACCFQLHKEVDQEVLFRALNWTRGGGLTMLELKRAAEQELGLSVRGVQLNFDSVRALDGPAILWLEAGRLAEHTSDHYWVYVGHDEAGRGVVILDPYLGVVVVPWDVLQRFLPTPAIILQSSQTVTDTHNPTPREDSQTLSRWSATPGHQEGV